MQARHTLEYGDGDMKDQSQGILRTSDGASYKVHRLDALEKTFGPLGHLPRSIRVLLEGVLRRLGDGRVRPEHVEALARWSPQEDKSAEVPFTPERVLLQDFTGVPAVVDLAALRQAVARHGGDPAMVNPVLPVDLVVDHSVQVDAWKGPGAISINRRREYERNHERYHFLKWGQNVFENLSIVPPGKGIVHQINLEYLAKVVVVKPTEQGDEVCFDTVVGTDSHTTMVGALGVLGWGVGGIEAEAAMLGLPMPLTLPRVVGVELTGQMTQVATATDLVLEITRLLRQHGVVGAFVEFYGDGLDHLSLPDRATIANMAPEYGATCGFFPVDHKTLEYLTLTGRSDKQVELVEAHARLQGIWRQPGAPIVYSQRVTLDLPTVEPALAGPTRPQDRVLLGQMGTRWQALVEELGGRRQGGEAKRTVDVEVDGERFELADGAVLLAAITSCTNTSNPYVMLAAGLLARNAAARGLRAKPWVKTSLAPGSVVVSDYLKEAGLDKALEAVGFHTVGYGCTTCIGNSGPLAPEITQAVEDHGLLTAAVLSGNRNFEGRVSPLTRGNYLASPPLVVAYAIAGRVDFDPLTQPLGYDGEGKAVMLAEIWPDWDECAQWMERVVKREHFVRRYDDVHQGDGRWDAVWANKGACFDWQQDSTYIHEPPFVQGVTAQLPVPGAVTGARCLVKVGDSVTTDHISPAGAIAWRSPAADLLRQAGVHARDFNTYGSRRGDDRVMVRGTFGNVRLRNHLAPGTEGGWTTYLGEGGVGGLESGAVTSIFEAAQAYRAAQVPLVVLAGRDYGMGSSRDWAAKGPAMLGVKAVLAESFERIHRSNLIGMGILPLEPLQGQSFEALTGREVFDVEAGSGLEPGAVVKVKARREDGTVRVFGARCRIDAPDELVTYQHGGILPRVLRGLLEGAA